MRGWPYLCAALLGVGAAWWMVPWATLLGTGGLWVAPPGDTAQALTGHLAFQAPGWQWPLLKAADLAWPVGRSIMLTDSNPLVSIAAKLLAGWMGHPINLLGVFLALCWVLQPVAAVYAYRGLAAGDVAGGLGAAAFSLMCPAWLLRHHVNLLGHFLIFVALGLVFRMMRRGGAGHWRAACGLLCVAILVHPYLFIIDALLFSAVFLQMGLRAHGDWRGAALRYGVVCAVPVLVIWLLSGGFGGSASGFGFYSMNALSPFWPQISGVFGAGLPVLDATGGQYEGFNYQGAGILLLFLACLICLFYKRLVLSRATWLSLALSLGGISILALTPRLYVGPWLVVPFPLHVLDKTLGFVQSSGRLFWGVGYAAMLAAIFVLSQLMRRSYFVSFLVIVGILQFWDTRPLGTDAAAYYAGGVQAPPLFALPAGAKLLRVVPACDADSHLADPLRLQAAKKGIYLADMRTARAVAGFDCEAALADGLEAALIPGEVRVFLPSEKLFIRQQALGSGVVCGTLGQAAVCSLHTAPIGFEKPLAPGPALPDVRGARLADLLGAGWRVGADGVAWSEGPYASLLFHYQGPMVLRMTLDVVAGRAGDGRSVLIMPGALKITLPDQQKSVISVPLAGGADAVGRIIFSMQRPVDPAKRGLVAPVQRAGLRLYAVQSQDAGHAP